MVSISCIPLLRELEITPSYLNDTFLIDSESWEVVLHVVWAMKTPDAQFFAETKINIALAIFIKDIFFVALHYLMTVQINFYSKLFVVQ